MVKDAWNSNEIMISKAAYPVRSKAPCPMSGEPAPNRPHDRVMCPDCQVMVDVRANGNFYKHTAIRFSEPRDVIVFQTGAKQVIEIDAADVPAFITQLRGVLDSSQVGP